MTDGVRASSAAERVLPANIGAVIFLGPPGAGKGTQAQQMARRWGLPVVATGDMTRALARSNTPLAVKAREIMGRGELIPDDWVNQLVQERLRQPDCRRGFLLDGYPRTPAQAQALETMLAGNGTPVRVIHFRIDTEEVVRRISGRRMCPECWTIYNIHERPPREPDRCDRDQTLLVSRPDDREDIVRERLLQYQRQTAPVIEFYRRCGQTVHELDATRPVGEVAQQLSRMVEAA